MKVLRAVDDRKNIIGASSIGAMLGLSQWRNATPYSVWNEAVNGVTPEQSQSELSRFALGHKLEAFIASLIEEEYGLTPIKDESGSPTPPCFQSDREGLSFLVCHPDRIYIKRNPDESILTGYTEECIPVEIKSSSVRLDERWGQEDSDEIPYDYLLQVYGYFLCDVGDPSCPPPGAVWVFRWSDNRLTRYIVRRPDEETLADIAKRVKAVWDSWQRGEVPPPTTFEESKAIFPPFEGRVEATQEILQKLSTLSSLLSEEEEKRKEIDALKKEIIEFLAGASTLTCDGEVLATYKEQVTNRFDQKGFKEANPDLAQDFYKTSVSRVFRLKGGKNGE